MQNAVFHCACGGPIERVSDERVIHACRRTSQSYGVEFYPVPYRRVQIDPRLTKGEIRYNWFADWR